MLQEQDKQKLDKIVQQMTANKESDSNIQLVVNDFKQKYSSPVSQDQGQPQEQPGFLQSVVQSAAHPFLKAASTLSTAGAQVVASGAKLLGTDNADRLQLAVNDAAKNGIDYGYFGKVNGFGQTGSALGDFKEAAGTGLEAASYLIGGEGAGATLAKGLKGKIIQGAYQGLKTGAAVGGTASFGQALQDAENSPSDVAYKTLFGTAAGAATGGALGAITPIAVKGITGAQKTVKRFTDVNQINTELNNLNTQVFKPTSKQLEKWSVQGKDPIKTYTEIFGTDVPAVGNDNRFTREAIQESVDRVDSVYKPAAEAFNTILRNSNEVNSLSKAEADAIKNLAPYNLTPEMEQKAIGKIQSNFAAIKDKAAKDGALLGDDSVPVAYTDNLKDKFWGATKNFGTEDATISNSVNSAIGHGFKSAIEGSIKDVNVQRYNKYLGDLIVLRDFLETKSGALAGTGGKMTRLMARVAGTVAGSKGGVIGSILGNLGGDKIAQIMINPEFQPYRWLISKKLQQMPKAEVLKLSEQANEIYQNMLGKRGQRLGHLDEMMSATRKALPAGKPLGSEGNPIITPNRQGTPNSGSPYNKSAVAIAGGNQPLTASEIAQPAKNPINMMRKNPIDNTVPQKGKNAIPNSQGGFIKGADGTAVKKIPADDKRVMKDFTDYVAGDYNPSDKVAHELEIAASRIAEKYNVKQLKSVKGLANEFGRILDDQGLDFGKIARNPLIAGAISAAGLVGASKLLKKK